MLGTRSPQRGMFEADHLYLDFVGRDSFYGFLATERGNLFRDEDFGRLYCPDNGRNSVPPSLLATALLLQAHDRISDEEAKARADFDMRWKVALGIPMDQRPFAKSTLQLFRAQLVLHDPVRLVFQRSLEFARESGYLQGRKIKVVLDTTPILGHGAVKDTYHLLADGIKKLVWALAKKVARTKPEVWAQGHELGRYYGSSVKGQADIDWSDEQARRRFLKSIVADADRLLETARQTLGQVPAGSEQERAIQDAAQLLSQLLLQDVERPVDAVSAGSDEGSSALGEGGNPRLKQGVARNRMVSAQDPEMRHGHKSASQEFDGFKGAVAVDPDTQLITAVGVLKANAWDSDRALELVEASEANTGAEVEEAIGDCSYGDGTTRQIFEQARRKLVARVRRPHNQGQFSKEAFAIDLEAGTCTCPAGEVTQTTVPCCTRKDRAGAKLSLRAFQFQAEGCDRCALRSACLRALPGHGRTVRIHPQERLLQAARVLQASPEFGEYRKKRQAAEHRLARLVQLGIRKSRYFGQVKTLFQLILASTVANLTLTATKTKKMRTGSRAKDLPSFLLSLIRRAFEAVRTNRLALRLPIRPLLRLPQLAFRLDF
jgi:transposase